MGVAGQFRGWEFASYAMYPLPTYYNNFIIYFQRSFIRFKLRMCKVFHQIPAFQLKKEPLFALCVYIFSYLNI